MKRWLGLLLFVFVIGRGRAAHAAFTADPSPLEIGGALVGASSSATISLSDPDVTVPFAATLSLATGGTCGEFSVPSASFTYGSGIAMVSVTLTPTSPGAKTCVVSVKNGGGTTIGMFTANGTGQAPQINVLTPGPFTFGPIDVNQSTATKPITVRNDGNAQLKIASATIAGTNATSFSIDPPAPSLTLEPTDSATWNVKCTPKAQGALTATFTIVSDSLTNKTVNITLNCTGNLGQLALDQATLPFGDVLINGAMTKTLKLSNNGNVSVSGIAATFNPNNKGYSIDAGTPVPTTLAAMTSVDLTVRFDPKNATDGGTATLGFTGTWGASNTTSTSATLTGQVISLVVNTAPVDFGDFRFDKPTPAVRTISNTGSAAISIDSVTFVPDAGTAVGEVVPTVKLGGTVVNLPTTLNGNQTLDVTIAPQLARIGPVKGKIVVHPTLVTIPDQNIAITGNATAAKIMAPATTDFGAVDIDGAPPKQTIMIANTGDAALDVSAITVMAGGAATFTFKTAGVDGLPSAPRTINAGTALPIEITYTPTMTRQTGSFDSIVLQADLTGALGGVQHAMLVVQGRGIDRHLELQASPTFPDTFRNPGDAAPIRPVTISNTGEAPLKITAVMVAGGPVWSLVDDAAFEIPGGSSHQINVRFAPTAIGAAPTGEITLVNNDNDKPMAKLQLMGNGIARSVGFVAQATGSDLPTIDLGITGVGIPLTVDGVLEIANMDAVNSFTIREIKLDGAEFKTEGATTNIELPPATSKKFTVAFDPNVEGERSTLATLYLDDDTEMQAQVRLVGRAAFVEAHGSGGCNAAGEGGWLVGLGLVALGLVRRRRSSEVAS